MANDVIIYGEKMRKVAVIVETRKHKALPFVLNNVMSNLSDEWRLQIFHGTGNSEYISEIIQNDEVLQSINMLGRIGLSNLNIDSISADDSSLGIMLTEDFWNRI